MTQRVKKIFFGGEGVKMKAIVMGLVGAVLLATFVSAPLRAQTEVSCAQEYTVAAGDWLSTIAEKYLGSASAYPAIMTQTNLKSQSDFSFATVVNPDSIEVGWKLCIPDQATADALNGVNPPPGLDKNALYNATYSSELMPGGKATLKDGTYTAPADPSGAPGAQMTLTKQIAYGDLNGTPSAAVVTGSTGGGSGFFYIISVMQAQDGKPVEVATTGTGDRSPVLALVIENNQVLVDYLTQGPDQPMCCGTLRVVDTYALEGNKLNQTAHKELGYLGPNGETPGQTLAVTGQVVYREKIAMPEGAVVKVQVADVSRADAPADVIGEQTIENPGNVPVKFSVPYDGAKIQPNFTYAVSARIEVNGQLMWISTTRIPVITNGAPTSDVTVPVERVGSTANTASSDETAKKLTSTTWEWQGSTYKDGTKSTPTNPSQYTAQFEDEGRVSVKADCNSGGGPYQIDGNKLTIGNMVTTLMLCPEGSLGTEFMRDLQNSATFAFDGDNLVITMKDDGGTMTLAPSKQASAALTGVTWQWQGTAQASGDIAVKDPTRYTITFNQDGTANIKNDCNNILANYTLDGSNMKLELGPSTLVACPPDSQDALFSKQLSTVTAYSIDGGMLLLDLADGGVMKFSQGK
ncbi:MAG: META domain-containing protein [Chloroflexota bacterium]|nr:MAG: META domain-containing protein [Chloroflexota bacterium]